MFTIAVTRNIPEEGIRVLKKQKKFRVRVSPHDRPLRASELRKFVKGADAILSLLTDHIDGAVMDAAGKQLRIVANYAVGFDNIDLPAAKQRGVVVTNTPGDLITEAVAEHTFALMIALAHRIVEADAYTRAGLYRGWAPMLFLGTLLKGKTIGIVGSGRIGAAVAERAAGGIGMHVLYHDVQRNSAFEKAYRARYEKTLSGLLKKADVVTLHVPLLPATHHLIGAKELRMMKRTAFLINTARGPVVNEKALVVALTKGKIGGAALDVFECEPSIDCDPTDHYEFQRLPNVILTPHIASAAYEARAEMSEIAAKNIINVLHKKNPLNPAK